MKIIIEHNDGEGQIELCRYSADVCPRTGETVSLQPSEGDEIKTWRVISVNHFIAPNYEVVTVFVGE